MNDPATEMKLVPAGERERSVGLCDPLKVMLVGIVAAGASGAESAALEVAQAAHLDAPCWSWADAHTLPILRRLAPGKTWTQAVAHNVRDSDATMVVTFSPPNGPTRIALARARARNKPAIHVTLRPRGIISASSIDQLRAWLVKHNVRILHLTGSRQENDAGIEQATSDFLVQLLEGPP